ncbi:uncharacterized protein EMH_0082230 [Eimeria mitis]|uniref:Uncharacterized protein n=1 Tax=Eimeria mitis TaxID=44415 RepID=U6K5X2_9EIME|nr:uncharacterized protein EMH_0082230 [Eimeria mitis]CDJ33385.1 hypothetical protein EMH_0082230 [Eimeria mitis]
MYRGEGPEEETAAAAAEGLPPGISPSAPRRDESGKQHEYRSGVSRRGSIIGFHRALGRRYSMRGVGESSSMSSAAAAAAAAAATAAAAAAESPRVSAPSFSRPGSRASSRRSLLPHEDATETLRRHLMETDTNARGMDGPELPMLRKTGSATHASPLSMHPISEERAAPSPTPDCRNGETSPDTA